MRLAAAVGAVGFCGVAAAVPAAVFWVVLGIPARLMQLFSLRRVSACSWALTLGCVAGAVATLSPLCARLGQGAGALALLLCGFATGAIAAALSEMLELLPRLIWQLHLRQATRALCFSFALGKALGALVATLTS